MPILAVAKRRVKLTRNRSDATTTIAARYGTRSDRSPPSIASSIVRWTRIGMVSESSVNTSAHASPTETSRHWARQRGTRCRIVGQRVRSEGSTFVTGAPRRVADTVSYGKPPRACGAEETARRACAPSRTCTSVVEPRDAVCTVFRPSHAASSHRRPPLTLTGRQFALDRHHFDVILPSMELHIDALNRAGAGVLAALGDEDVVEQWRRLADAVEPSLRLRLIDLLSEAALSLNSQLDIGHIEVRMAGRDPELVFVDEPPTREEPPAPGDDLSARITLRLPEGLKASLEVAAAREAVSTNAWIVGALARALEPRSARRSSNRLQGFARSSRKEERSPPCSRAHPSDRS